MSDTSSNKEVDVEKASETGTDVVNLAGNPVDKMSGGASRQKLLICALGVFVSYFYYGILQESITKGKYGEEPHTEKFTYTMSLVFIQCIINFLFAKAALTIFTKEKDTTPSKMYGLCSLSYLGAMLASNKALQYISYPTQVGHGFFFIAEKQNFLMAKCEIVVLGKSAKPIPVMLLGILLARKRYPPQKFAFIFMICLGVAMFMYKDKKTTSSETTSFGLGEVFLLVSLTLDGLTGATQDRMRSDHKTGAYSMMSQVNLWSVLWLAIGLVISGEGLDFIGFVQRHPSILSKMVTFGLASAVGQVFIFVTVTSFGPLPCSIITTTRKFFTILGSVIIFQNPMLPRQWLATVLVFMGLGLDSMYGKERKDPKVTEKASR